MAIERMLGQAMKPLRVGEEKLVMHTEGLNPLRQDLEVTSPIFLDEAAIPEVYTVDGDRGSPAICWSDAGPSVVSYAVVIEDIDVPLPQPFVHGIAYNIPSNMLTLPEDGLPRDGDPKMTAFLAGRNSTGHQSYVPPSPIRGHGVHRYVFQVFALDRLLPETPILHLHDLQKLMKDHVLAMGRIIGTYERR
jgi:Raf kinase inhibitor-like YbhB/YbcL family protein